jgi:hypothetical protein
MYSHANTLDPNESSKQSSILNKRINEGNKQEKTNFSFQTGFEVDLIDEVRFF